MAIKSYMDRIKTNWDELSPERQSEIRTIWNRHEAEFIMRRINQQPPEHQEAIYNAVLEQLKMAANQ